MSLLETDIFGNVIDRVAILERELGEVKKLLPKKTDSPYRGF